MNDDSTSPLSPGHPTIEDTAIEWLTEREDGFSPAREREFTGWRRADPRHAAAVVRLEKTLGLLGEIPQFRAELNAEFNRSGVVVHIPASGSRRPAPSWHRGRRTLAWGGLAAALLIGVSVAWESWRNPEGTRYTTTVAGYERARLDDGSTLELNVASTALVQFSAVERRVELKAGEAHFAVVHDAKRSFVVHAAGVRVRAVGTAFNVRLAANEVEVIVVEGKVRVERIRDGAPAAESVSLVGAGERTVVPRQAPPSPVQRIEPATLRQALAWQGRLVEFSDARLADVVRRFNARNRLQLVLADSELGSRRIGGTFALDEVEAFARLLERDGTVVVERRGTEELLLRRSYESLNTR